jgi:hypothetical protein
MSAIIPALFSSTATTAGAASATGTAIGMANAMSTGTAAALSSAGMTGAAGWTLGDTLTTLGLGASALSAVGGGLAGAEAQRNNARMAEQQGLYAEDQALRNEEAEKREAGRQLEILRGQQRRERGMRLAAWGASGVQTAGSPLRVMESLDYGTDRNAAILLAGSLARRQSVLYGGRSGTVQAGQDAAVSRAAASGSSSSGYWRGLSTLALGGRYYA